jgi:uroporphyrinogen-III decarboxylase
MGITIVDSLAHPKYAAHAQLKISKKCGFDGMDIMSDFLYPAEACGSRVRAPNYGLIRVVSPAISELSDFDSLSIPDPKRDHRFTSLLEMAGEVRKQAGQEYFQYTQICGPFTLLGELRGLEKLFFDLIIEPQTVEKMMRYSVEVIKRYIVELETTQPDAMAVSDPTSSANFLGDEYFPRFSLPYIEECASFIKKEGQTVLWHICGDSYKNLRRLTTSSIHLISADAPVSLPKLADELPGKVIIGNLAPEGALTGGPPFEVIQQSVKVLTEMRGKRHILGAGCGLSPDFNVECAKMMRYACDQFELIKE